MSRNSTITIKGRKVFDNDFGSLLQLIKTNGGAVEIDGCIQGAVLDGDGMDFVMVPIEETDPYTVATSLLNDGRLTTLDCYFDLEGKRRHVNIDTHYDDRFVITLNANRVVLEDGTTDFSWYYKHLVCKLANAVVIPESIVFCDDL